MKEHRFAPWTLPSRKFQRSLKNNLINLNGGANKIMSGLMWSIGSFEIDLDIGSCPFAFVYSNAFDIIQPHAFGLL